MATQSVDRIVETSGSKYKIGETLGKGGYSWVKKGEQLGTAKEVALKFTAKGPRWDARDEENIKAEMTALERCTKVQHPNVMRIFEVEKNCLYPAKGNQADVQTVLFVLELASGGELFDILFYTGKLSTEVARTFFHQLINGVDVLHKNGVVHRDIKPQNLLLDGTMNLKITDFGLSKIFNQAVDANSVMNTTHVGTKGFQAPEQLEGKPYTEATDIFACGVVLFILLTAYPPFENAMKKDYWYKELMEINGKPAKTRRFWKKHRDARIPPDAQDFIQNLLAWDPHKRFSIDQIRDHSWMKGKVLSNDELLQKLNSRLRDVKHGRMTDTEKKMEQTNSIKFRAGVSKAYDASRVAPDYKNCKFSGITQFETKAHPDAILDAIDMFMADKGHTNRRPDEFAVTGQATTKNQILEFEANIYSKPKDNTNVVTIQRLQGGFFEYGKFFNMLLDEAILKVSVVADQSAASD